jgi:hypothetical protein
MPKDPKDPRNATGSVLVQLRDDYFLNASIKGLSTHRALILALFQELETRGKGASVTLKPLAPSDLLHLIGHYKIQSRIVIATDNIEKALTWIRRNCAKTLEGRVFVLVENAKGTVTLREVIDPLHGVVVSFQATEAANANGLDQTNELANPWVQIAPRTFAAESDDDETEHPSEITRLVSGAVVRLRQFAMEFALRTKGVFCAESDDDAGTAVRREADRQTRELLGLAESYLSDLFGASALRCKGRLPVPRWSDLEEFAFETHRSFETWDCEGTVVVELPTVAGSLSGTLAIEPHVMMAAADPDRRGVARLVESARSAPLVAMSFLYGFNASEIGWDGPIDPLIYELFQWSLSKRLGRRFMIVGRESSGEASVWLTDNMLLTIGTEWMGMPAMPNNDVEEEVSALGPRPPDEPECDEVRLRFKLSTQEFSPHFVDEVLQFDLADLVYFLMPPTTKRPQ